MIEDIGFTGTSDDMTGEQVNAVDAMLQFFKEAGAKRVRHGLCIGSDETFHRMARKYQYWVIGHPGVTRLKTIIKRSLVKCDDLMPPKWFITRNHDIVDRVHVMIATPREFTEVMIGSGTWATIRYARKTNVPLVTVFPSGMAIVEHVEGYLKDMSIPSVLQLIARQEKNTQDYATYRKDPYALDPRD